MAVLLSDINWTVASIAIVLIGCWILAEFIECGSSRGTHKPFGLTVPLLSGPSVTSGIALMIERISLVGGKE
jgi:hypothetical protein